MKVSTRYYEKGFYVTKGNGRNDDDSIVMSEKRVSKPTLIK